MTSSGNSPIESDIARAAPQNRRLGRYELRYRLAEGGMATVYLAQLAGNQGFHKWIAIKTIHDHIARNEKFIRMFLDEARLTARIDHPNACTVFDFGEADGAFFIAMEYLHGEHLGALAKRAWSEAGEGMDVGLGARIIADVARGLHSAHELTNQEGASAEVVHRDVSPQNIFVLYNGISKIVDFGIAKSTERLDESTRTGELKGKMSYMSPEQLDGAPLDRRTDIWALGVVLWEMTVGQRLFKRENEARAVVAVLSDPIPRPSARRPEYPPALEAIVMRALERDASKRYATAGDFARDLEVFLARLEPTVTHAEVSSFMRRSFAGEYAAREKLLRSTAQSTTADVPLIGNKDITTSSVVLRANAPPVPADPIAPTSRRPLIPALVVIGLLSFGATAWMLFRRGAHADHQPVATAIAAGPQPARPAPAVVIPVAPPAFVAVVPAPGPAPPAAPIEVHPVAVLPSPPSAVIAAIAPSRPVEVHREPSPPVAPEAVHASRAVHVAAAPSAPAVHEPVAPHHVSPAVAPAAPGTLSLMAVPSAEVFEGSHSLGFTPIANLELPAGRHRFRLHPSDGAADRTVNVTIVAGERARVIERW